MTRNGQRARGLVFVSAGLGLDGGGRAAAGRLLARSCAQFAEERRIGCEILALGDSGAPAPARYFGADQRALARAVWSRQWRDRRTALAFDLLGPARVQAYLPGGLRAPYLIQLHGLEVWRPLEWDRRRALAKATVACAVSSYTIGRARPFCPGLNGAAVLPLALEERKPEGAVDAALLSRLDRGFLLIAGRMDPRERYKGHDPLLEALTALPEARLVVAGDGDDRRRLEQKAAALGLADRVAFTGFLSEATLAELYRRCAAFAMPSRGEGFGLVYLEAMRAGKPVLAARESAAAEIVVDGATGVLVDPDDREELRGAISQLLGYPGEARRMGEAGHERWRREFGAERFRARLEPMLERLVGQAPPALRPSPPGPLSQRERGNASERIHPSPSSPSGRGGLGR